MFQNSGKMCSSALDNSHPMSINDFASTFYLYIYGEERLCACVGDFSLVILAFVVLKIAVGIQKGNLLNDEEDETQNQ